MTPSEILQKHEDANEYHFHEIDRKWIIEAMEEYAKEKSEKAINLEISDMHIKKKRWEDWEEFNKKADYSEDSASPYADGFTRGAKWVLEQLKKETTMSDKKQTAVEWLVEQMFKQGYFDGNKPLSITNLDHLEYQAKQMEKEQIVDAYYQCGRDNFEHIKVINRSATDYYNETYNSKQ